MKYTSLIILLAAVALAACDKKPDEQQQSFIQPPMPNPAPLLPAGHPPIGENNQGMADSDAADTSDAVLDQLAVVVSTQDIPQFTFIEVRQDGQTRWLAASTVAVKKGDVIAFDHGSTMENFTSKTLKRTFASITFVNHVNVAKK